MLVDTYSQVIIFRGTSLGSIEREVNEWALTKERVIISTSISGVTIPTDEIEYVIIVSYNEQKLIKKDKNA